MKPLPERLMQELTAHRTLALRDAVATNPRVALTALLHKLVTDLFVRVGLGAVRRGRPRHRRAVSRGDLPGCRVLAGR
ncbi:MAG: hypothetical protein INR68_07965 [Methylobacterium mesophilicum]|nr:hypothetical protein [Methylobacterium mesophilicum]